MPTLPVTWLIRWQLTQVLIMSTALGQSRFRGFPSPVGTLVDDSKRLFLKMLKGNSLEYIKFVWHLIFSWIVTTNWRLFCIHFRQSIHLPIKCLVICTRHWRSYHPNTRVFCVKINIPILFFLSSPLTFYPRNTIFNIWSNTKTVKRLDQYLVFKWFRL